MRDALEADPHVEVVAECRDDETAIERILALSPDLVLLAVGSSRTDGFEVVETVGPDRTPPTAFVASDGEHAVRAFEVGALDYVLKPFEGARIQEVVRRARSLAAASDDDEDDSGANGGPPFDAGGRFVVRGRERIRLVPTDRIDWIEAYGNYVRLHEGDRSHVVRATLGGVAARLDPAEFARIHRSTIVRVDRVTELVPWFGGDYEAILRDETRLKVSRRYKRNLLPAE